VISPGGSSGKDRLRRLLARARAPSKTGDVSLAITTALQAGEETTGPRENPTQA
jgi:hypothetical protein